MESSGRRSKVEGTIFILRLFLRVVIRGCIWGEWVFVRVAVVNVDRGESKDEILIT